MNDDNIGCIGVIVSCGFLILLFAGIIMISHDSYVKRKAHCKTQGGQWIESFKWDDSKCLEAAEVLK